MANELRQAAKLARVHLGLLTAMMGRAGHGHLVRGIVQLLVSAAREGKAITVADISEADLEVDARQYERGGPSGDELTLRYLAEEGLLQITHEGDGEELQAQVAPEFREAVMEAFSHWD